MGDLHVDMSGGDVNAGEGCGSVQGDWLLVMSLCRDGNDEMCGSYCYSLLISVATRQKGESAMGIMPS
jgi:hypothetical protein